jgi:DNA uptake protein ComE-like DNA-binding protein
LDDYRLELSYSWDTISTTDSAFKHNRLESFTLKENEQLYMQSVDPNKVSYYELLSFGMSSDVAHNFIRFRERGAVFQSPEDLLKVYGMNPSLLEDLKCHFHFIPGKKTDRENLNDFIDFPRVELNQSDSTVLKTLPGIGTVLSARIIKYRDLLGGYYSTKQLGEVYGISDSLQMRLSNFLEVDTLLIKKIDLNRSSFEQLANHPYITKYQAKAIIAYRRLMGSFASVDQVITNYLIPEETYYKLFPYLEVK